MSLPLFQILFDNPQAVYLAGQQVTGRVLVRVAKEKRIKGVQLNFKGQGQVKWSESTRETRHGQSRTVTYYFLTIEPYFENNFFVVGGPNADMKLPPGDYVYPFVLVLPPTIPSSFEGTFGHVRYTIKAVIVRPWKFNHECKVAFTVVSPLDLNFQPHLQDSVQHITEKTLCCLCCRSRPISLVVTVPCRGFVPGQKCYITLEVDNPTTRDVIIKCILNQVVTYTASCGAATKSRVEKKSVAEKKVGEVEKFGSKTWTADLPIPSLPASDLMFCNIINIAYTLTIKGVLTGVHRDMSVEYPVVIGTFPFRSHFSLIIPTVAIVTNAEPVDQAYLRGAPDPADQNLPSAPLSEYPLPPPSYEECVLGQANIRSEDDNDHVQGNMNFAPKYPMYQFK